MTPSPPGADSRRQCDSCSLCCTVLRVDELRKLAGVSCVHQDVEGPGCSIHDRRPGICREYRCLWLRGALEAEDRPDRIRAVIDVVAQGPISRVEIREAREGIYQSSARLQAIAEEYRASMPVQISDIEEVLDPTRPYRVLLPGAEEYRISGDWIEIERPGQPLARRRLSAPERVFRRIRLFMHRRRISRARSGPRPIP